MSEALNGLVDHFVLLVQCNWRDLFRKPFDYFGWYGIERPFPIVRLPLLPRMQTSFIEETYHPVFDRIAVQFSRLIQADMVYTRSARAAGHCINSHVPVILEAHFDPSHWGFPLLAEFGRSPYLRQVVTISPVLQREYLSAGVPEEKILVAFDAVDLHRFQIENSKTDLRSRFHVPVEKPLVVYCGHLYENRGIETIVEAARSLADVTFLFVGGSDEDVKTWRERASCLPNVRFTGFVPNKKVPSYLHAADLLLMNYSSKCSTAGWMSPMKLFEYMAAHRAIIASDLPSLKQILRHAENAWLVKPDDAVELADAICKLLRDRDLAERLAQKAFEDVQGHTWEQRVARVLEAIRGQNHMKVVHD